MYPENSYKQQAGAGLPIAIFIVTVLSLMVLGMSQLQESSGKAISLQIQSQRAFFAAESGAQVVIAGMMPADPVACPEKPPEFIEVPFAVEGLANCTAKVLVSSNKCTPDSGVVTVKSLGVCGIDTPEEARRTVEIRLR
ncbi:pilus assembly PilX N-terminal domain-containing protein [Marinobacter gelidimuriae]|uniref:pilus assembly PilX N-terminal domain-containing protein n=1 Tax=Marinobacter gelidimuriae TaxID=2739064 RepID=UPI000365008C|nr:hypothetical protein [Marinobacter gelidimuriae]